MTPIDQTHVDVTAVVASRSVGRPPPEAMIRKTLAQVGILGVRIIGPPGSGKTELIEATLKHLAAPMRVAVIVVNPAATRDADRLKKYCGHVAPINAAVPDAAPIWHAISTLKREDFDMVLIEAAGGLAPMHDLGQDATVAVFAVSGGDDKGAEYHTLLKSASAILLTKTDLLDRVKFDRQVFGDDVKAINSTANIFEFSSINGSGMMGWLGWLERLRASKVKGAHHGDQEEWTSDDFIG